MAQMVKNMLVKQETQVRYLSWDNPLDKRMTTHSSIAGKILWTRAWWATAHGISELNDWVTHTTTTINLYEEQKEAFTTESSCYLWART